MKAEIIAVGTELLLGQIVNTNARFLSEQCANIGLDVYYQTVVGDNVERICSALQIAASRADVIICTGGLGPTLDDVTRDALASHIKTSLVIDDPTLKRIEEYFITRNINMIESNRRQALTLLGATALPNDVGMAVGTAIVDQGKSYILLPGPPKELKVMFEQYAKSWLRTFMGEKQSLYSLSLKFAGIGESALEDKLVDLIQTQSDPTIAPYAKEGEVMIRLTTRATSENDARSKIKKIKQEIVKRVGDHLYAEEDVSLDYVIVQLLQKRRLTIAAAESCTGGLFSNMITSHPGSSNILTGSVICYTNEAKQRQLAIPRDLLEGEHAPGAISSDVAALMAKNVMNSLSADIGISFTGVAGPSHSENKEPGLVYIGIAIRGDDVRVEALKLSGSREMIKLRACRIAFYQLWKILKDI